MDSQDRKYEREDTKRKIIDSLRRRTMPSNGANAKSGKSQTIVDDHKKRGMSIARVKERMERLRHDVVNNVGDQFDDMMSDVMYELEAIDKFEGVNALHLDETEKYRDKRKAEKNGALPEKQFLHRNSVLTDLYEIKHFRTIYNFFIVILIILSINTAIYDLLHTGSTNLSMRLIMRGFAKFSVVIEIWLVMVASTFVAYAACSYWAHRRVTISQKFYKLKAWDYGWILLFVAYQIALIVLPTKAILWAELPPISSVVVLTEETRMVMKMHAFVRSASPVAIAYKPHTEGKEFVFPGFSKFLYFMFAPTLIYRDSYPRTKEIRWRFALWHFIEVALVIFNMAFLFERFLLPPFEEFGKHPFDVRNFILSVYGSCCPGMLVFLSGFYCLLHAWMNAAAEVMRFGDRLFYKDWWNSTAYSTYYRHWNVVVHDWLYTYIYKDMYEIVTSGNRTISVFAVFFASSLFHEYILAFTFGFFFPVSFGMFGVIGYALVFLIRTSHASGNMFLLFSLTTGFGTMISLYAMEYFARVNCPRFNDGIADFFIPRSFFCF